MRVQQRKSILVVGFDHNDKRMYPHLFFVIEALKKNFTVEYFRLRERGWGLANKLGLRYVKIVVYLIFDLLCLFINSKRKKNDVVIAIDVFAYVVCCFIFPLQKVVLWSQDIIDAEQTEYQHRVIRYINGLAKKYLSNSSKIIIQDNNRLKLLLDSIGITCNLGIKIFLLPVCLPGSVEAQSDINNIPVVMQSGTIHASRYSDLLVEHYSKNQDSYSLILRGFIDKRIDKLILRQKNKPINFGGIVDPEKTAGYIRLTDIGFVGYEAFCLNSKYFAMASGQMVDYLRMAKPVVVMGDHDLRDFVETNIIGKHINSISELNRAIDEIVDDYDFFSTMALRTFYKYFDIALYSDNLIAWIENSAVKEKHEV